MRNKKDFTPPTDKQRDQAEELGIGHLINMYTSSEEVSRLLAQARHAQWRMKYIQDTAKNRVQDALHAEQMKKELELLRQRGLAVGVTVNVYGYEKAVVQEIRTYDVKVWAQGRTFIVNPPHIKLDQEFQNPDKWLPSEFVEITERFITNLLPEEQKDVRRRDLFYPSKNASQLLFLPRSIFEIARERINEKNRTEKERREKEIETNEMKRSQMYCIQCGTFVVKGEKEKWSKFGHKRRCDDCLTHPHNLQDEKYCRQCGQKFSRSHHENGKSWAARANCYQCKPEEESPTRP